MNFTQVLEYFYSIPLENRVHDSPLFLVDFASVADLEDINDPPGVGNRIDNPVVSLPDPVSFPGGKLLTAMRPLFVPKRPDPLDDPVKVPFRDQAQFICGRPSDKDLIFSHSP